MRNAFSVGASFCLGLGLLTGCNFPGSTSSARFPASSTAVSGNSDQATQGRIPVCPAWGCSSPTPIHGIVEGQVPDGVYSDGTVFFQVSAGSGTFYWSPCSAPIPLGKISLNSDGIFFLASESLNICRGAAFGSTGPSTDDTGIPYSILDCYAVYQGIGLLNGNGDISLNISSTGRPDSKSYVLKMGQDTRIPIVACPERE